MQIETTLEDYSLFCLQSSQTREAAFLHTCHLKFSALLWVQVASPFQAAFAMSLLTSSAFLLRLPPQPDLLIFFILFLLDTTHSIYRQLVSMMAESRVDRRLRFLRSGINADFTIVCKDREWRVHRSILAAESEYFQKLRIGDFSVWTMRFRWNFPLTLVQEASEGKATFPDEDPAVIDQVLVYLYAGTYDDLAVISKPEENATTSEPGSQHEELSDHEDTQEPGSPFEGPWLSEALCILGLSDSPWHCRRESRNLPEITVLSSVPAESITVVLSTGIMVYRCAKMMDLTELQSLAFQRFIEKERYFLKSNLANVLTTLYKHTESDDEPLRHEVTDRCVRNHEVLKQHSKDSVRVLEEYEAGAWAIGVKFWDLGAKLYKRYEQGRNDHKATRVALEEQTASRSTVVKYWTDTKQDLADVDYEWDRLPWNCTKCGREMSTSRWISQRGPNGRMQFMCKCSKKCEARQPL